MSINDGVSIWHARFNHINFLKLNIIMQKSLINDLPHLTTFSINKVCEGCQYDKVYNLLVYHF